MGLKCNSRVQTIAYPNATPSKAPSQEISCSQEEHVKISQEIKELQAKAAIVEAPPTQISFVSQILVEKKGGGGEGRGDRGQ